MKKHWMVIAAAGVLLAFLPALAQQQHGNFLVRHVVRDLNLSDDQRAQIKSILQSEQPAIRELVARNEQLNQQLRARNAFDEAYVRSIAQQKSSVMADSLVEKEKVRARIMAVLNADQQQKLNQLTDELRSTMEQRISTLGDAL